MTQGETICALSPVLDKVTGKIAFVHPEGRHVTVSIETPWGQIFESFITRRKSQLAHKPQCPREELRFSKPRKRNFDTGMTPEEVETSKRLKLKRMRELELQGYTQQYMSKMLGVSVSTLKNWRKDNKLAENKSLAFIGQKIDSPDSRAKCFSCKRRECVNCLKYEKGGRG